MNWLYSKKTKEIARSMITSTGSNIVTTIGMTGITSALHSISNATPGNKFLDFTTTFRQGAGSIAHSGMFSIVSTAIEPITASMENRFLASLANASLAGALLEIRNGTKSIINGAISGAFSQLQLYGISQLLGTVLPRSYIQKITYKRQKAAFEKMSKTAFVPPFELMKKIYAPEPENVFEYIWNLE